MSSSSTMRIVPDPRCLHSAFGAVCLQRPRTEKDAESSAGSRAAFHDQCTGVGTDDSEDGG